MPWQASPSASCRSCRTLSLNDMPQDSNQLQIAAPGAPVLEKVGLGAILLAYAVLLGAAYLFAYWRTMGFDIFPYLSVQNYVTAPLNRISVLVAAPALFTVIVFGRTATPENNRYLRFTASGSRFNSFRQCRDTFNTTFTSIMNLMFWYSRLSSLQDLLCFHFACTGCPLQST